MKKITLLLALVCLVCFSNTAFAVELTGRSSVAVQAVISSTDQDDMVTLLSAVNKHMNENLSMGVSVMYIGSDAFDIVNIGGLGKFHFNNGTSTVIPYVGATLGVSMIDAGTVSETEASFGVMGGIDQFISESTAFNYELAFISQGDYDVTQGLVGLKVFFD